MKNKLLNNAPIGVFDSGLGGLTVLKSLQNLLPNENYIYFGDTAHVPYGNKSSKMVIKYSQNIVNYFEKFQVKAIVIACNTASSVAYKLLQKTNKIPLFDVVTPCIKSASLISKSNKIGIIGTTSTINSKAYSKNFQNDKKFSIYEIACPLFVPLIEEGWSDTLIAKEIAKQYLNKFSTNIIDTLILGCTHYPIMKNTILSSMPYKINLILSGDSVGHKLLKYLTSNKLINTNLNEGKIDFFVSDFPLKFDDLGARFFGNKLKNVKQVSLD